jgi:uncharacterized protein (TIGR02594 family)
MKDSFGLSVDFIIRRVPAYFSVIPIAIMGFGHVYFGKEVNTLIMYDMTLLAAILFTYPRIKLSEQDNGYNITKNLVSYFLLIFLVIPASLFEFFGYGEVNSDLFNILTMITAAVFGLSKVNLSRSSLISAATSYADIKQNYDIRRGKALPVPGTEVSNANLITLNEFPDDLNEIKTRYQPKTLRSAATLFIGVSEIKGRKHNNVILQFGKWAGIQWYVEDEIPWCAVFLNAMLYLIGKPGTKSALAKSFLDIGTDITLEEARRDSTNVIAVYHRGKTKNDMSGHVDIVDNITQDTITLIGGNINDSVTSFTKNIDELYNEKIPDGTRKLIGFKRL